MFFLSLSTILIMLLLLLKLFWFGVGPITLHVLNSRFEEFAFFYRLFCSLTLNHRIKSILPVPWCGPDLPVTNSILSPGVLCHFVSENNRSCETVKETQGIIQNKWYQRISLRSLAVRFSMSPSDDISLSRYFKTSLNQTRIFFDRDTTKTAVWISWLVNPNLAIKFTGLLFQYGGGNCEGVVYSCMLKAPDLAILGLEIQ